MTSSLVSRKQLRLSLWAERLAGAGGAEMSQVGAFEQSLQSAMISKLLDKFDAIVKGFFRAGLNSPLGGKGHKDSCVSGRGKLLAVSPLRLRPKGRQLISPSLAEGPAASAGSYTFARWSRPGTHCCPAGGACPPCSSPERHQEHPLPLRLCRSCNSFLASTP